MPGSASLGGVLRRAAQHYQARSLVEGDRAAERTRGGVHRRLDTSAAASSHPSACPMRPCPIHGILPPSLLAPPHS